MDNKKKIMIAIIIIVITVLAVTLFALESYNFCSFLGILFKISENVVNEIQENTTIENEIDENVSNNTVTTTTEEQNNTEQPTTTTSETNTVYQSDKVYNSNSEVGTTNKKEEAIDLVKQEWGEDNSVIFTCDSVTSDGEYIIAVISKESATVKNYFKVNLENKTVEIKY